jgi:hypothetical protein
MLSKTERDYLSGKLTPNKNYENKIIHSIRKKMKIFYNLELPLVLAKSHLLGENWVESLGKLTSCQTGLTPRRSGFAN